MKNDSKEVGKVAEKLKEIADFYNLIKCKYNGDVKKQNMETQQKHGAVVSDNSD
jgi:hypothetical protein